MAKLRTYPRAIARTLQRYAPLRRLGRAVPGLKFLAGGVRGGSSLARGPWGALVFGAPSRERLPLDQAFPEYRKLFVARTARKAVVLAEYIASGSGAVLQWGASEPGSLRAFSREVHEPLRLFLMSGPCDVALNGVSYKTYASDLINPYYNPRKASELETILNYFDFGPFPSLIELGAKLRSAAFPRAPANEDGPVVVLVQDRSDPALTFAPRHHPSPGDLIAIASRENPGAEVVAVLIGAAADGIAKLRASLSPRVPTVLADAAGPLLASARRVYTINAVLGLSAVLREAPTTVFGAPFYAGWGLTEDRMVVPRRRRKLDRDRLAAAVFGAYLRLVGSNGRLVTLAEVVGEQATEAGSLTDTTASRPLRPLEHVVATAVRVGREPRLMKIDLLVEAKHTALAISLGQSGRRAEAAAVEGFIRTHLRPRLESKPPEPAKPVAIPARPARNPLAGPDMAPFSPEKFAGLFEKPAEKTDRNDRSAVDDLIFLPKPAPGQTVPVKNPVAEKVTGEAAPDEAPRMRNPASESRGWLARIAEKLRAGELRSLLLYGRNDAAQRWLSRAALVLDRAQVVDKLRRYVLEGDLAAARAVLDRDEVTFPARAEHLRASAALAAAAGRFELAAERAAACLDVIQRAGGPARLRRRLFEDLDQAHPRAAISVARALGERAIREGVWTPEARGSAPAAEQTPDRSGAVVTVIAEIAAVPEADKSATLNLLGEAEPSKVDLTIASDALQSLDRVLQAVGAPDAMRRGAAQLPFARRMAAARQVLADASARLASDPGTTLRLRLPPGRDMDAVFAALRDSLPAERVSVVGFFPDRTLAAKFDPQASVGRAMLTLSTAARARTSLQHFLAGLEQPLSAPGLRLEKSVDRGSPRFVGADGAVDEFGCPDLCSPATRWAHIAARYVTASMLASDKAGESALPKAVAAAVAGVVIRRELPPLCRAAGRLIATRKNGVKVQVVAELAWLDHATRRGERAKSKRTRLEVAVVSFDKEGALDLAGRVREVAPSRPTITTYGLQERVGAVDAWGVSHALADVVEKADIVVTDVATTAQSTAMAGKATVFVAVEPAAARLPRLPSLIVTTHQGLRDAQQRQEEAAAETV